MKRHIVNRIAAAVLTAAMAVTVLPATQVFAADTSTDGNDSFQTATTLGVNDSTTAAIDSGRDEDFYKITPDSDGRLDIRFRHVYQDENGSWNVKTYVYDEGEYKELTSYTFYINDKKEEESLPFIGVKAGTAYYIKVSDRSNTVGTSYSLFTTFNSNGIYEKEDNGSFLKANEMPLNGSFTGVIGRGSDEDFYKFTATADGKLALTFSHEYRDENFSWYVRTYTYSDNEYVKMTDWIIYHNEGEDLALPYIGVTAGQTYYIMVRDGSDSVGRDYTIKSSFTPSAYYEKEINNTYAQATQIAIGKKYGGVLHSSDEDNYKVTPTRSGIIDFTFYHDVVSENGSWYVYVYQYVNGNYNKLADWTIYRSSNKSISMKKVMVAAGETYYIKVRNSSDTIGVDYSVKAAYTSKIASAPKNLGFNTYSYNRDVYLYWDSVNDVTGYEVFMKTSKKGRWKKVATTGDRSITLSNKVSRKGNRYFKVRAYVKNGGKKAVGKFSYVRTVKKRR